MSRPRLRTILLVAGLGVALALPGCFWLVLRTRTLDASALAPFAGVIGHDLPLLRPVRLVRTRAPDVYERPWRIVADPQQGLSDDEPEPLAVPAGTVLRFDAARLVRGGTSGATHPVLLGTLRLDGTDHALEYRWGERRYLDAQGRMSQGPPLRFLFPLAPWQQAADPTIYTLPEP